MLEEKWAEEEGYVMKPRSNNKCSSVQDNQLTFEET